MTTTELTVPAMFRQDADQYEGVRPLHIYLLRTLFTLIFLFVGYDSWSVLIEHDGPWDPMRAAAWSMFAAYSLLSFLGILRPLKMLPIVLFVVAYKSIWLLFVAYPLWAAGTLAGSPAEGMAKIFLWVPLAIVFVPWKYVLRQYILGRR